MRPSFHLFVLKSVIGARDQGVIITVADIEKFFDKESLVDCILSLSEASVNQKCYCLWYELNKRLVLRIRTGACETEEVEVGGVVGQDTCGASLVSQHNIDSGVDSFFRGSTNESFYGTVRLKPLLFVDDCLRVGDGVREAQAWHFKLAYAPQEKMLSFHKSKSIYLVYGSKKYQKEVIFTSRRRGSKSTWRYMVKYNPLPSGDPSGFALGNSFSQRVIFDHISLVSSQYRYSMGEGGWGL